MTNYSELYHSRLTTADELASRVESGWTLGMDAALAQTPAIMSALAERAGRDELSGFVVSRTEAIPNYTIEDGKIIPKYPMLQAHRGVAAEYPENTMSAFCAAVKQGCNTTPRAISA